MNQKKVEKPQLQGLRNKTRKRDEKEKYDPVGFRDKVFQLIEQAGTDLEQVSKALEAGGSSLDYRRYAEPLFDIIIAGGLLAPGGSISDEGDSDGPISTDICVFKQPGGGRETIKAWYEVLFKLIRRYKYLEKGFDDELKKLICYLKGFSAEQKRKLAELFVISFSNSLASPSCLLALFEDYLVKDGLSVEFAVEVFRIILLEEKDTTLLSTVLKKAGIESRLMELLPINKRTPEIFTSYFREAGLQQIVDYQQAKADAEVRKEFLKKVDLLIKDEASAKEISAFLSQHKAKSIPDHEFVVMIWNTLMNAVEWSKKEEIVGDQALKYLKQYTTVLQPFTSSGKAELSLLNKVQEYCYDNMNFMKVFQKIVMLFYKLDVISEDTILLWYREAHLQKGKSVFLQQMKTFVEWLQKAEEEGSDEDEGEKNGQQIESNSPDA